MDAEQEVDYILADCFLAVGRADERETACRQ